MKLALPFILVAAAGSFAHGQSIVHISTYWTEMVAGTNTPVLNPDGEIQPGEGALIGFNSYASHNGANAIGQVVTWNGPGVHNVTGELLGHATFVYDLTGTGADAIGTWNHRLISPVFSNVPQVGYISLGGALITALNATQRFEPGSFIDNTNPIANVWRGVWNPASYEARTVHFAFRASVAVPAGQQNAIVLNAGPDPSSGLPMRVGAYFQTDFGPGVDIPISPGGGQLQTFCYPNCDGSSGESALSANDFMCFLNLFGSGDSRANCDGSVRQPTLTANDFMCFMNKFAAGCP